MSESLWTIKELADFLKCSQKTIYKYRCKTPEKLPPCVPNIQFLRWDEKTVKEFYRNTTNDKAIKMGRPRSIPTF
ncbi:hypothetical protein JGUZn3_11690 [Entomobacter blattae]|uniref:Helix-turn-helix domain-containing protein n=1 Tax=Entomobacter blattae TaxID=2762277 RepID=A0A7H1NP86_9PROT|nr:hypothetical protein JGUZn3_03390 [Entomobacter blattae]QNT78395.1 hypothetical protein JGUZn3_11690 [Entomobacter blattae]